MDEAKSLVNMAVSATFAAMFLAAAVGLVALGYALWGFYAREEAANQRLSDYANYSAFDNTTVRGQEVAQLISDADGEFFVMIFNGKDSTTAGEVHSIDDMTLDNTDPVAVYTGSSWTEDYVIDIRDTDANCTTIKSALSRMYSNNGLKVSAIKATAQIQIDDSNAWSLTDLQKLFLDQTKLGNPNTQGYYAAFKSTLIYEEDGTADIIGVVLVRQGTSTNQF